MAILTFEQKLERYAELIVRVGLNLQAGQRLVIIANPLEVAPLVRLVATSAYQNKCRFVNVIWVDEQLQRIRYQHAPRDTFEEFSSWASNGTVQCIEQGDAYLQLFGTDPKLFNDQDPNLIAIVNRTRAQHVKPIAIHQQKNTVQWAAACASTQGWATKVFPDESPQDAEDELWDAIFKACRSDNSDPVASWQHHLIELGKRKEYLTAKQYTSLHFKGPGTDLTLGLPEGHLWHGGESHTQAGIPFVPNLPTEEVYTLPHKYKTQGTVVATKPLSYSGYLIRNFSLTFSEGKVVNFSASEGEDTLRKMLETDENSGRLGEVALIPHQSPISQSGLVFLSTIYDENASDHLALGSAYRYALTNGETMSDEEFGQAGGNDSLIHVDFMFGSGEMNVDGLRSDGIIEPIMRAGDWAFDV